MRVPDGTRRIGSLDEVLKEFFPDKGKSWLSMRLYRDSSAGRVPFIGDPIGRLAGASVPVWDLDEIARILGAAEKVGDAR